MQHTLFPTGLIHDLQMPVAVCYTTWSYMLHTLVQTKYHLVIS